MSVIEEMLLNPTKEKLKELNELIKNYEVDYNIIEERILSSNNALLLYLAGINIEWINLGRISHSLVRTKDSFYMLRFGWYINKLEDSKEKAGIIKDLASGIIRAKKAHDIYYFARDIKDAPIEKLILSLAKTSDPTYIFYALKSFYNKISVDTRITLSHRIIALKDSRYILAISKIVSEISIIEYANGMLNAKKNPLYIIHLCMFLFNHDIPNRELKTNFIATILNSHDYKRISNLIIKSDNVPYKEMIDYLIKDETNYFNTDFWLNYILPIAMSNKACSSYAVEKIIESNNIEVISIAIFYLKDKYFIQDLEESLNNTPDLNNLLKYTTLGENVKKRVRTKN